MSKEELSYLDALRQAALEVRMTEMLMREIPFHKTEEIGKAMEFYKEKVEILHSLVRTDNLISLIGIVNALDLYLHGSQIFDEERFTQDIEHLYKPFYKTVDIMQKGN